jgi:hypothetical protein
VTPFHLTVSVVPFNPPPPASTLLHLNASAIPNPPPPSPLQPHSPPALPPPKHTQTLTRSMTSCTPARAHLSSLQNMAEPSRTLPCLLV